MTRFATMTCATLLCGPVALFAHEDEMDHIKEIFAPAQIISGPSQVDCTLSGGEKAQCFSITVKAEPKSYTPGPWCPTNISDSAEQGGIWLDGGKVYDVDGAFIENLPKFYSDNKFELFNPETGDIKVTDTKEKCELAARPDVDEAYQSYCVQCELEYVTDEDATSTYTIPLVPVDKSEAQLVEINERPKGPPPGEEEGERPAGPPPGGAGGGDTPLALAVNGIRLDQSAPVAAILGAYTLAPFDDCGGHVNLHVGYHYHAATKCLTEVGTENGHATLIGVALDGYPVLTHANLDGTFPDDLDQFYGHVIEGLGYHYHAGTEGSNKILGGLKGQTATE